VPLTCQEDLDNLIRLRNKSGSSDSAFSIRLFNEPAPVLPEPVLLVSHCILTDFTLVLKWADCIVSQLQKDRPKLSFSLLLISRAVN